MLERTRELTGSAGAKAAGAASAVALTIGATYLGLVSFQLPAWAIEMTRLWGPGFLMILLVFCAIAYYVPRNVVRDMAGSHRVQASALKSLAESVKNLPQKHDIRSDEIIIGQELINRNLEKVEEGIMKLRDRLDRIEEKVHG